MTIHPVYLGLAQSRHQWEDSLDGQTLELPQSRLAQLPSFSWLVVHLLVRAAVFRQVYNRALTRYRSENKLRSPAHPAPDLVHDGEWLETPFWVWTAEDVRRRSLYVCVTSNELKLSDCGDFHERIRFDADDLSSAVEQFQQLSARGISIQTRALTTTLIARLIYGDLFLHGIGGAKYDRATDSIIEQFFAMKPPHYLAVSATKRLPIDFKRLATNAIPNVKQRLWAMKHHPEKFISTDKLNPSDQSTFADLLTHKQKWIEEFPTPQLSKRRYVEIRSANESLRRYVAEEQRKLVRELDSARDQQRRAALLGSRDYSFVLYPSETLAEFLRDSVLASL